MSLFWKNGGDRTAVDVQPGGSGYNWIVLDPDGSIEAPSGGGRDRETLWGRGGNQGGLQPRGFIFTSNPHDWSLNITYPLAARNFLLRSLECPFNVRARERCGRLDDMVAYAAPGMIEYADANNSDTSYSDPPAAMDGVEADVKRSIAAVAAIEILVTPVAHDDITGQALFDADINRVLSIGQLRCAGDCGPGKTEEDEYLAVTDRDSTPGYSGNATARLGYTADKGQTWTTVPIDPFTLADATDVVFLGDRIVAFSPSKAPAYASLTDILNGVTAPNLWTTSTGFSSIVAGNFPSAASAPNSATIFAVGTSGQIWKSTDGGISFTRIDNGGTTTNNLTCVDFSDTTLGYIGGASATLIRYYNGALTKLTVTDSSGNAMTGTVNAIRTPAGRGSEVYMGTSAGEVWRSRNATNTRPTYEKLAFNGTGSGSITDLCFVGYKGYQLWAIQTNSNAQSRLLRDHSGGAMSTDIEIVGDYVTPSNFKFNSIAMANVNAGLVGGQIHETYGFLGRVRANTPG